MNCKQGDLAIVVRSEAGNAGKIVECVQMMGDASVVHDGFWWGKAGQGPMWLVQAKGTGLMAVEQQTGRLYGPTTVRPFPDSSLRPLRGLDETEDVNTGQDICIPA